MAFKLFDRVQETASTTGTGDFTLSGAITGFKTFGSRYSTGDTLYYVIQEVDTAGAPDGGWEVGLGTYSAANTLTRTTVLSSSNSDALVSFASGEKRVSVTMTALQGSSIRERVTTNRTYYVRTDGSDSNTGLANTSGGAFLTIQAAVNLVSSTLDISPGVTVTIQVGDGTYTGAVVCRSFVGAGAVKITGNTTTPSNCIVSVTSGHCFTNTAKATWTVEGFKLLTTTSGWALVIVGAGSNVSISNVEFGACSSGHIYMDNNAQLAAHGNYSIVGSAPYHMQVSVGSTMVVSGRTITLTGTPAFSAGFLVTNTATCIYLGGNTYSGSATGKRYDVTLNAVCNVNGGGATYLPGDTAGTTATGGQYA